MKDCLLPELSNKEGAIHWNDLNYEHPLLAYWPNKSVNIYISPESESKCWVYFDKEVFCAAYARAIRREDYSYRDNRAKRNNFV